jgi:MFS family permease
MLALGTMAGPPIGGFIATYFKWNYIFYINVPIGVVITIIGFLILPRDSIKKGKIDVVGTVLLSFSILCLFYAFTISTNANRNNLLFYISLTIAIFSFCYFLFIEKKSMYPIIDLTIFKNMVFSVSLFCTFISNMALGGYSLILPFYLEDVLKLSPGDSGLIMMIFAIILAVVSPFTGALADKIGSEILTLAGLVTMAMGLVLMATLNQIASYIALCIFICVIGLGYGLFQPPNNTLVMSNAPKSKLGIAGSLNAFARNFGTTFGISLSTMILYTFMSLKAGKRVSGYIQGRGDIFVYGMRYAFIFMGAICLASGALVFIKLINKNSNKRMEV